MLSPEPLNHAEGDGSDGLIVQMILGEMMILRSNQRMMLAVKNDDDDDQDYDDDGSTSKTWQVCLTSGVVHPIGAKSAF